MSWRGSEAGALRRGEATEAEPEERPALGGRGEGGGFLGENEDSVLESKGPTLGPTSGFIQAGLIARRGSSL